MQLFSEKLNINLEWRVTKLSVIHDYFGTLQTKQNDFEENDYSKECNPDGKYLMVIV